MFIGRENELQEIRASLLKHDYQGTLVYGRRRIGKTELIAQGLVDCPYPMLSFEFRRRALKGNLDLFQPEVKEFFHEPHVRFETFDAIFDYLLAKSTEQEYVLVLDEFSFLLAEDFSIESSLAAAIDKYKSRSKIHLFISGSYVGLMEKMIGKQSHSYGRFNHIIPLAAFDYFDSAKFYPTYTDEEKVMLYSVFGGIPYFNSLIDTEKSAAENIYELVVKTDSICEREINETVMAETTKSPQLNEILLAIVNGKRRYSDIQSCFNPGGSGRPDYFIDRLIDMGFVRKKCPINDETNKKKAQYVIADNLVDFYYLYLFAAKDNALRKSPEFYFRNFIEEDFHVNYVPAKFESIAKEFLIRKNLAGNIQPPFFKIGEYFFNNPKAGINRQFDVVTQDKNGYIAYECKYTASPITKAVIDEEAAQTSGLPDISFYKLGFIAKSGFENGLDLSGYNTYNLADFYSL